MTDQRPIVHIHGAADCADVWSVVSDGVLERGGTMAVWDLPMHGSNTDTQPSSIEEYADWVEATLEATEATDVLLSGHSMGALIALEVAGRSNPRVGKLALSAVGHPLAVSRDLLEAAAVDAAVACDIIAKWSTTPEAKEAHPERIARHAAHSKSLAAGVVERDLVACNSYTGAVRAAKAVAVPTVVIIAERDKMVPHHTAVPIIEALHDVESITIEGSGHALEHERPTEIASILTTAATR